MTESIHDLANYIVREIEKEDFFYAVKHYGGFIVRSKAQDIIEWWDKV